MPLQSASGPPSMESGLLYHFSDTKVIANALFDGWRDD